MVRIGDLKFDGGGGGRGRSHAVAQLFSLGGKTILIQIQNLLIQKKCVPYPLGICILHFWPEVQFHA